MSKELSDWASIVKDQDQKILCDRKGFDFSSYRTSDSALSLFGCWVLLRPLSCSFHCQFPSASKCLRHWKKCWQSSWLMLFTYIEPLSWSTTESTCGWPWFPKGDLMVILCLWVFHFVNWVNWAEFNDQQDCYFLFDTTFDNNLVQDLMQIFGKTDGEANLSLNVGHWCRIWRLDSTKELFFAESSLNFLLCFACW